MEIEGHVFKKIVSGTWYSLHLQAKRATTIERKKSCLEFITSLREEFFCLVCRNHFDEFCEKNPPPDVETCGNMDFFYWTVDAHNNANELTGKSKMSRDDAEFLYYDSQSMCHSNCGDVQTTQQTN